MIARFEAERQALAMMDHPNIAKVLDAGTTDTRPALLRDGAGQGRADHRSTATKSTCSLRERLELFMPGLPGRAARPPEGHHPPRHQAHRTSSSPSTTTSAVPKVIDFGVAKATGQQLTERTLFTEFGQMVGTARVHEPRAGRAQPARHRHPQRHLFAGRAALRTADRHDAVRRRSGCDAAAFDEILRIIREEEPPKPSTRLSTLSESLPSIAANRHIEPAPAEPSSCAATSTGS